MGNKKNTDFFWKYNDNLSFISKRQVALLKVKTYFNTNCTPLHLNMHNENPE